MWREFLSPTIKITTLLFLVCIHSNGLLALPNRFNTVDDSVNQTSQNGEYYVIGLFSMRQNNMNDTTREFDDKAIRLYVKLRYFVSRQRSLVPYFNGTRIGFAAYDVGTGDRDKMLAAVVNILLEQKYRSSEIGQEEDGGSSSVNCKQCIFDGNAEEIESHLSYGDTGPIKTDYNITSSTINQNSCHCNRNSSTVNNTVNKKSNIFAVVSYMSDEMTKLAAAILSAEGIPFFAYTQTEVIHPFQDNVYHWFFSSFGLLRHDINEMQTRIETQVAKNQLVILLNLVSKTNFISNIHASELWDALEQDGHCIASFSRPSRNLTMATVAKHFKENGLNLDASVIWVARKWRDALILELDKERIYGKRWYVYSNRDFVRDYTFDVNPQMVRQLYLAFAPVQMYQRLNKRFPYKRLQLEVTRTEYKDILEDDWISEYLRAMNLTRAWYPFAALDFYETIEDESIESILLPVWWLQPVKRFKNYDIDKVRELLAQLSYSKLWKAEAKRSDDKDKKTNFPDMTSIKCRKPQCAPGHEPQFGTYTTDDFWSMVNAWRCISCPANYHKATFGNHTCIPCGRYLLSNSVRTGCYDPYEDYYLGMRNYPGMAVVCLSVVSLSVNLFIVFVFCWFKNTAVVRSTSLFTSLTQLVLYLVLFTSILFTFVGKPRIGSCAAQPVFIGFIMALIVALSINRSRQLLSALRAADRLRSPGQFQHFVSETMELFVLFLLLLVQVIVCAVSLIIVRPRVLTWKRSGAGIFLVEMACSTELHLDLQLCYVMLLAIYCVIQGYRARKLPKNFNDTIASTYSMVATVTLISIKFPLTESFERGVLRAQVNAVAVIIINLVQMVLMFAPKLCTVLFLRQRSRFHPYMFRMTDIPVYSARIVTREQQAFEIYGGGI